MDSRKYDEEPQITAQPKPVSDAMMSEPVAEPGLSIEPEDLGRQFLSDATEQSNFESYRGGEAAEMSILDPAPSDDPLVSPAWEEDRSLWQQTVERGLQSGGLESLMLDGSREAADQDQDLDNEYDEEDSRVVASSIRDVSLFDHEGKRPGEIEPSYVEADEQAAQARRQDAAKNDNMSAIRRSGSHADASKIHHSRRTVNAGRR